jgi:ATP-dependent RNA helicase DeaD
MQDFQDFLSFGLPESLLQSLEVLEFKTPTPIQAAVIPHALEGKDILGSAQTGTGKTGAFGIPLVAKLIKDPQGSALIMTPTRELADQVINMLESLLGKKSLIKTALLIGGESMFRQLQQLKARPRLIVGTPGRINDHLERGSLKLNDTNFLVLDETDRMLDVGFAPQIDKIIKFMPRQRQTLLFSATMSKKVTALSEKYLSKPIRVSFGSTAKTAENLKQEIIYVAETDKHDQLLAQLEKREGSIIVFVRTKFGAEKMARRLRQEKHSADAIHGNLSQHKRQLVISDFRDNKYRVMVATDVAARGLEHVKHVINYDLPQCAEDYIHRVGRTARAGAEGSALCFVTPAEKYKWQDINRFLHSDGESEQMGNHRRPSAPKKNKRRFYK